MAGIGNDSQWNPPHSNKSVTLVATNDFSLLKKYLLFLSLQYLPILNGQVNLVLNPSFEDTIQCSVGTSQIEGYVMFWRGADGDYFNANCQGFNTEVPSNVFGSQLPRTGAAYAGGYCTIVDTISGHENARDFLEGRFSSPLISGRQEWILQKPSSLDILLFKRYDAIMEFTQLRTPLFLVAGNFNIR